MLFILAQYKLYIIIYSSYFPTVKMGGILCTDISLVYHIMAWYYRFRHSNKLCIYMTTLILKGLSDCDLRMKNCGGTVKEHNHEDGGLRIMNRSGVCVCGDCDVE